MLQWMEDRDQFQKATKEHRGFFVLAFLGEFSEAAQQARAELEQFASDHEEVPVLAVDVEKVKGVHKEFGVDRVPTVLAVENGEVNKSMEGVQSARFLRAAFGRRRPFPWRRFG